MVGRHIQVTVAINIDEQPSINNRPAIILMDHRNRVLVDAAAEAITRCGSCSLEEAIGLVLDKFL